MTSRIYPVKITGPHLTLRELTEDDATDLRRSSRPRSVYMLAVADMRGELVGTTRLALGEYESGQIGFALRPDQWGRGLGTETVQLLQRLGFDELALHRIWGARDPANTPSARTMARAGMIEEGTIRGHVQRHGIWCDSLSHSILAEEYAARSGDRA